MWPTPQRIRKPKGPTARARASRARKLRTEEAANKQEAKRRDGERCRFPLCGCGQPGHGMKSILTSSHDMHKGMGGDPTGVLSLPEFLITLCKWRHQDAPISRHAGNLRTRYLTPDNNNGPVAWDVKLEALNDHDIQLLVLELVAPEGWVCVATETEIGKLAPLQPWQWGVLSRLSQMDC
jgi:hypothetical protein